jgi:thioredoxin-related protein
MMIRRDSCSGRHLAAFSIQAWSAEVGEDGLHKQDWFALTFRDVAEDIEAARDEGKRLVMIFEQRGCIYCAKMHEKFCRTRRSPIS